MSAPTLSALLRPRKHARHARPSKVGPVLAAGGMAAAFAVIDGAALAAPASAGGSEAQFDRLAGCESGGRWNVNTGNGYYGGLQFNLATWRGLGFGGYPHQASRETQIAAGQKLQGQRGWGPWPSCSRKLGLSGDGGVSPAAAASLVRQEQRASRATRTVKSSSSAAFSGVLTTANSRTYSASAKAWQQQMRNRGWRIAVDGKFGPQSASVAQRFAAEKGIAATPGTVNAAVFSAAWTAPR
ncbi:MAG: Transglycosylase-like domain protein [Frankiales bacterium]|nr:Transglycosylase-like domain protein [Frankiales bacterium]